MVMPTVFLKLEPRQMPNEMPFFVVYSSSKITAGRSIAVKFFSLFIVILM